MSNTTVTVNSNIDEFQKGDRIILTNGFVSETKVIIDTDNQTITIRDYIWCDYMYDLIIDSFPFIFNKPI